MKIEGIVWLNNVVDKLAVKHGVEIYEVEEISPERLNIDLSNGDIGGRRYLYGLRVNICRSVFDRIVHS